VEICGPAIVQRYSNGFVLTQEPNSIKDPDAAWQRFANEYKEFSVGTVRGVSASLAERGSGADGGVQFVEDGVLIDLVGNGTVPLKDLMGVVETLRPLSPSSSAGTG
jgi:hypothetical protein